MTAVEFEQHKSSLIAKLLEADKNLGEESSWYWSQISSRTNDFDQSTHDASIVSILVLSDLIEFYKEFIIANERILAVVN